MERALSYRLVCATLALALAGCSQPEPAPGKPWHHTTQGFRNPPDSPARNSWTERLPWILGRFVGFSIAAEAAPTPPDPCCRASG